MRIPRSSRLLVAVAASLFLACGDGQTGLSDAGDAGAADLDAGSDDAGNLDAGGHDAGSSDAGGVDAGEHDAGGHDAGEHDAGEHDAGEHDAGDHDAGGHDAGEHDAGPVDAGEIDAGTTDAGWTFNDVPGQCDTASDCATGGCQGNAPGGFCNLCQGEDPDCDVPGSGETYTCTFGSCLQDCDNTADCPTGLACSTGGVCGLLSCATTPCPPPYVCDPTFLTPRCVRPACVTSATCPGQVPCRGGYCIVEP